MTVPAIPILLVQYTNGWYLFLHPVNPPALLERDYPVAGRHGLDDPGRRHVACQRQEAQQNDPDQPAGSLQYQQFTSKSF